MTICWRVSLGKLKICPQFKHIGIASRAVIVFSVCPEQFSLLTPYSSVSSSKLEHEVMLTVVLSRKAAEKDLSSMLGLNNQGLNRTAGSRFPN